MLARNLLLATTDQQRWDSLRLVSIRRFAPTRPALPMLEKRQLISDNHLLTGGFNGKA